MKNRDDVTKQTRPIPPHCRLWPMGQKSAQLPYLELAQHPKEKSWAKNPLAKAIKAVAKVYLPEKNWAVWGTLKATPTSP